MRVIELIFYIFGAIALALLGVLIPAHIGVIDDEVLHYIALRSDGIDSIAKSILENGHVGQAELLAQAVEFAGATDHVASIRKMVIQIKEANEEYVCFGGPAPYLKWIIEKAGYKISSFQDECRNSIIRLFLNPQIRDTALTLLRDTRNPTIIELLKSRFITHTTIFPPATTPAGRALDAAIIIMALLAYEKSLDPQFRTVLEDLASGVARGRYTGPLEAIYLDILAIAQIANWDQIRTFIRLVPEPDVLRTLTYYILRGNRQERFALLATATFINEGALEVANYLKRYGEDGIESIKYTLGLGKQPLVMLLRSQLLPYHYRLDDILKGWHPLAVWHEWMLSLSAQMRYLALILKYWLWFNAFFLVARTIGIIFSAERSVLIAGIRLQRQIIGAILLLGLAIWLAEPYFREKTTQPAVPQGWAWPKVRIELKSIQEEITKPMSEQNWIIIGAFFVIQLALHIIGMLKLREIKRLPLEPEVKLQLLDNEENLFDAGLYVGLGGTVIGLLLMLLKVVQIGPVVAYSSSIFGILFVSFLKICLVRPYRRSLLLERAKRGL